MIFENIRGSLAVAYQQAEPGTIFHIDQLVSAIQKDPLVVAQNLAAAAQENSSLETISFFTADSVIVFVEDGRPKMAITREQDNLILRHLDTAFADLTLQGKYMPPEKEAYAAIRDSQTAIIDLCQLETKGDEMYRSMEFLTWRDELLSPLQRQFSARHGQIPYDKLNPQQRALAERIYGVSEFVTTMDTLRDYGTLICSINIPHPNQVLKERSPSCYAVRLLVSNISGTLDFRPEITVGLPVYDNTSLMRAKRRGKLSLC